MNADEKARLDRMFGEDQWVAHENCPVALDAGQSVAYHHVKYHLLSVYTETEKT